MFRILIVIALLAGTGAALAANRFADEREGMIAVIKAHARSGGGMVPSTVAPAVLKAMEQVPRHQFVPARERPHAYGDRPLPIGHGQTISQPYIVALMSDLLNVEPGQRVLEIGTGSGYQAAVLAEMGIEIYTMEIIGALSRTARQAFEATGYDGIIAEVGDGYYGWPDYAPFDGIIVTAAASHIPPPLVEQLRPGARMIIPVGPPFMVQQLLMVTKNQDGTARVRQMLPVSFVPLTGGH